MHTSVSIINCKQSKYLFLNLASYNFLIRALDHRYYIFMDHTYAYIAAHFIMSKQLIESEKFKFVKKEDKRFARQLIA